MEADNNNTAAAERERAGAKYMADAAASRERASANYLAECAAMREEHERNRQAAHQAFSEEATLGYFYATVVFARILLVVAWVGCLIACIYLGSAWPIFWIIPIHFLGAILCTLCRMAARKP